MPFVHIITYDNEIAFTDHCEARRGGGVCGGHGGLPKVSFTDCTENILHVLGNTTLAKLIALSYA